MKKIGVITFYRPINYGAVLQALSLQIVLSKNGFDSEIIDYRFDRIEKYRRLIRVEDYVQIFPNLVKLIKRIGADIVYYRIQKKQIRNFNRFIDRYLPLSSIQYDYQSLCKISNKDYDSIIVGSDLVWSPVMTNGVDPVCFLDFISTGSSIRRVSYAASIGTKEVEECVLEEYRKKISNFDYISVREDSARELLQNLTSKKIVTVLDPSLLTDRTDWDRYIKNKEYPRKYIVSFMLEYSPILIDTVNKLADETGYDILCFDLKNYYGKRNRTTVIDSGPDEFLSIIRNAEIVVTNSFHGCAFSVLFNKQLWCIPHTLRGTRMVELLKNLGMQDRIVTEIKQVSLDKHIDYSDVINKLQALRMDSFNYLSESLK